MVYIYTVGCYPATKKEWNSAIHSNGNGPREYLLSEISQRKTNTVWYHLYLGSKKMKQTNVYSKAETDSQL